MNSMGNKQKSFDEKCIFLYSGCIKNYMNYTAIYMYPQTAWKKPLKKKSLKKINKSYDHWNVERQKYKNVDVIKALSGLVLRSLIYEWDLEQYMITEELWSLWWYIS